MQERAGFHRPGETLFTLPGEERDGADLAQVHAHLVFEGVATLGAGRRRCRRLDLLGNLDFGEGRGMWSGYPGAVEKCLTDLD